MSVKRIANKYYLLQTLQNQYLKLSDFIDYIENYGHAVGDTEEEKIVEQKILKLKVNSEESIKLLNEISDTAKKFYSY